MMRANGAVRFGAFVIENRSRELRRSGIRIRLPQQSVEVLLALLERPGEVVTHEELIARLWPSGTVVGYEHSIHAAVRRARGALGDTASKTRFIETVPRVGYRYVGPAVEVVPVDRDGNAPREPRFRVENDVGRGGMPPALGQVIDKALEKNGGMRYQCAAEIRDDLEHVKEQSRPARTPWELAARRHPFFERWGRWLLVTTLSAVTVGAAIWLWDRVKPASESTREVPLTALPGAEWSPTFSPDGSQVAFVWDGEKQDNADIYVKVIGAVEGSPLRLTSNPAPDLDPAWSPDGRWIAFRRITPVGHEILLVSPLGTGVEQRLCTFPCRGGNCSGRLWPNRLSWSADSKFLAVSDVFSPHSPGRIFLLDIATRETRSLGLPSSKDFLSSSNPAFSPDGRKLAFIAGETGREYIYVQALDTALRSVGPPRRLVQAKGYPAVEWTADSRGLIYSNGGFWRISADGGRPERLLEAGGLTLAIARHGKRLAYSAPSPLGSVVVNIYRAGRQSGDPARFLASSWGNRCPQYSDDGTKTAFISSRGGTQEVWACSSSGGNCFQVTSIGDAGSPRFSPDGRHVAFDCARHASWDIYVGGIEGGPARRLTFDDSTDVRPSWSRDGKWIYFTSDRSGAFQIWRIPVQGGIATQVTRRGGFEAVEARDGTTLYYVKRGEDGIWSLPLTGGEERLALNQGEEGRWALGARGIYLLVKDQVCAIDYFDFTTRSVSRIRTLPAQNLMAMAGAGPEFAVSPDERWFLYSAVERNETDLMLLENFR